VSVDDAADFVDFVGTGKVGAGRTAGLGTGALRNWANRRCAGGTPVSPTGDNGTKASKTSACAPNDQASARHGIPPISRMSFPYWCELSIVTML
jgi:hypothetical protein